MAIDDFIRGYIDAALWSSTDNSDPSGGESLDANFDAEDIDKETLAKMRADCNSFLQAADPDNVDDEQASQDMESEQAGHDFWLSRNGHGTGFFDGNYGGYEEFLQELARRFGEYSLFVVYPEGYQVLERTFEGGDFETKRDDRRPEGGRFSDPHRFGEYHDLPIQEEEAEIDLEEEEDEPDVDIGWYVVSPDGAETGPFDDEDAANAAVIGVAIRDGVATLSGG